MSRTLGQIRRARKARRCEACRNWIQLGDLYWDARLPPNHEDVGNTRWWRSPLHPQGTCPPPAW